MEDVFFPEENYFSLADGAAGIFFSVVEGLEISYKLFIH
jgi:hypothetical protein